MPGMGRGMGAFGTARLSIGRISVPAAMPQANPLGMMRQPRQRILAAKGVEGIGAAAATGAV